MTRTKIELLERIRKQNVIIADLEADKARREAANDERFAEGDAAAVESWPSGSKQDFDWMLDGAGWKPGDGPVPGVFGDKPKGDRCLWSCSWSTSIGLLSPDRILPVEYMTMAQLQAEILDVIYRARLNWGDHKYQLLQLYLDFDEVQPAPDTKPEVPEQPGGFRLINTATNTPPEAYRWQITKLLRQLRVSYPDYVWPFSPPPANLIRNASYRPGWPDEGVVTPDFVMPVVPGIRKPGTIQIG